MTMRSVLVAILVVVGAAQAAAPTIRPVASSTATLTILTGSTAPAKIERVPGGTATVASSGTAASDSLTGSTLGATLNSTWVNDTMSSAMRIRLAVNATSNLGDCASCKIQLRGCGTTSDQIVVASGAVTTSVGPWLTFAASGASCSTWTIWATATSTLTADKTATIRYYLELVPPSSTSVNVTYQDMRMDLIV